MKSRVLLISLALISLLTLTTDRVYAGVNDFVIRSFVAEQALSRTDKQGQLDITERIEVTFTDNNHGIERAIPNTYKGHSLDLKINSVTSESNAPAAFTTRKSNDNTVLRIGDANRTVTGNQQYTINYTLRNVIEFYPDHDELYWDINGDQWRQTFEQVTADFRLPSDLKLQEQACYTGSFGGGGKDCSAVTNKNDITFATTRPLQAGETLTALMSFPKGYFSEPTVLDWLQDNYGKVLAVLLPPLFIGGWAYSRWLKHGKDLRGRGVIVPEYEAPDKLSPAEVGTINSYGLSNRDISATIVDLAIRKYVRIVERTEKKLLKDKRTYSIVLLKQDISDLLPHEKKILDAIFPNLTVGTEVELSSLKTSFYKVTENLQSSLPNDLTARGYFAHNPKHSGAWMYTLAVGLAFAAFFIRSWVSIGMILAAVVVAFFGRLMPKRTPSGVMAKEHIQGLKLYLNTAEKDRLRMMQSPNAPYAAQSSAPAKTVDLFEKLLPFAIVLGVENAWAGHFKDIYTSPPDWYSGNWTAFNALYLTSALTNSVDAMNSNFTAPESSSGSGFGGGGGFSGGGGGGGGGGGW